MNRGRLRRLAVNLALSLAVTITLLAIGEVVFRWRYAEPLATPSDEVAAIQQHLSLDDTIGFTWKPNVAPEDDIRIAVMDATFPPLSTDAWGFWNPPGAIDSRQSGATIDAIGLGDSFMEHAAYVFHEAFAHREWTYYSLAIHRQAPPHFTRILERYGPELKPNWVIYGLFENDFEETIDFDRWEASGIDWFAFHSGTWCGRPVPVNAVARAWQTYLRGYDGLARVVRARMRGDRMSVSGPSGEAIARVKEEVERAIAFSQDELGARVVLVLIPSRATATSDITPEAQAFDAVVPGDPAVRVVDLRVAFAVHPDPPSLYYETDGHWNADGMALAARAILKAIDDAPDAR